MIATASEPQEFVPSGRKAVAEHPGPNDIKPFSSDPSEQELLQHLQNVDLSESETHHEFWSMREIFDDFTKPREKTVADADFMCEYLVNSEEELYVKKNLAVWTRGLSDVTEVLPHTSFSCETPIKFAFFCSNEFSQGSRKSKSSKKTDDVSNESNAKKDLTSICLIDQTSMRVYCNNGEDFLANLEFPISQVWQTCYGLLLEKVATTATIQSHTISMPRLFSLSHPLDEMCPVLYKSASEAVSYVVEADFSIIYSAQDTDLLLMYDNKSGKHFIALIRKATEEEIQYVSSQEDSISQMLPHFSHSHRRTGSANYSHNSSKYRLGSFKNLSTSQLKHTSQGYGPNTNYTTHVSKFLSSGQSFAANTIGSHNRTNMASPLCNLQSTIGQHLISQQDIRRIGQAQPSKPIIPEYCLEHIWSESTIISHREFIEMSTRAFRHTDLVAQHFICYLLPRSCKLQMVRLFNEGQKSVQVSNSISSISAKDAVPLQRMKMIAVLDPDGSLIVYTGTVQMCKVHITESLITSPHIPVEKKFEKPKKTTPKTLGSSFPRRSTLLPTMPKSADNSFEEQIHMLSPVPPLNTQSAIRNFSKLCMGLRDPTGNRLTLVYPAGKMSRITLPVIAETSFVKRCITTLRHILTKNEFLELITAWYSKRNPMHSRDYSIEQEWEVFKTLLTELTGCAAAPVSDSSSSNLHSTNSTGPKEAKKRRINSEITEGTDEDWEFLVSILAGGDGRKGTTYMNMPSHNPCHTIDTNAILFKRIPAIFYGLHLIYEDFKLNMLLTDYMKHLAKFLYQLAIDMQLSSYIFHYQLDYPELVHRSSKAWQLTEAHGALMTQQDLLHTPAPSIYKQLDYILKDKDAFLYPYADNINDLSRNVLQIVSLIMHGHGKMRNWIKPLDFPNNVHAEEPPRPKRFISTKIPRSEQVIEMLNNMGIKRTDIETLPIAIHLIIAECLEYSRMNPPIGSTPSTYELILRDELVAHTKIGKPSKKSTSLLEEDSLSPRCAPETDPTKQINPEDGMENIDTKLLSLRFPDDMRICEVRRCLSSSEPVLIDLVQSPGTSDHEFIEEQEKQLFAICIRTMALQTGRGMFTLRTLLPSPTESMPIPKLCLTGKEPIKGATIEMTQIEFPPTLTLWPSFHNGVAAGLKISPNSPDVDSTWIIYNRPKKQSEVSTEHAGFLMALGLNGHIKALSFTSIYEYLVKCDEMTSVGLLLGISATHRGTMDNTTTKLLSVHVEALLPATALELDVPQTIQIAALMGVGLVYMGTAKRHIAEVLLQEIRRPPGPEMENSVERESYGLTAGLALGLVTLGQGEAPAGLQDLQLPDTLHYYMVGGNKRPLTGSQKEKYKLPSFQVREGDHVNIDVTSPGATLALGLMFFNSDNEAVAEWMEPPNTRYLLDLVRPDLLLLRIISRGLILWSRIEPTEDWLFNQFPEDLRFDIDRGAVRTDESEDIDHEAITQAYCNIITGSAFCIGLKYAGTEDPVAFKTLRHAIKLFLGFPGKYVGENAGRSLIESNLMLILISLSLVFAGSGHLEILRIIRYLRSRIGSQHANVSYGSHLAIHMALGLLFLGAGRFTIAKTPEAIAALVCAFFPKFPNHSNDNRFHLQAFRHLYVLAVEPRLFLPRDIDTKKLCLCNISVLEIGSDELRKLPMAPCMLPELSTLRKVVVDDPNYWPVSFERDRNWDQLLKALENSACIDIKKRSGCLSHLEDPDRLRSLLAETLTSEQYLCWEIDPAALERFSNDPRIVAFLDRFLHNTPDGRKLSEAETARKNQLTRLFHNAVIKDKMHVFPIYLGIFNHISNFDAEPNFQDVWQMKLIDTYLTEYECETHMLFSKELVGSHLQSFKTQLEDTLIELNSPLRHFLTSSTFEPSTFSNLSSRDISRLVAVIIYYNLTPNILNLLDTSKPFSYIHYFPQFRKLNLDALSIFCLARILRQA